MITYPISDSVNGLVIEHPNSYQEIYPFGSFELCVYSLVVARNEYIRIDMGLLDINSNKIIQMPYYWEFDKNIDEEGFSNVKNSIQYGDIVSNLGNLPFLDSILGSYFSI